MGNVCECGFIIFPIHYPTTITLTSPTPEQPPTLTGMSLESDLLSHGRLKAAADWVLGKDAELILGLLPQVLNTVEGDRRINRVYLLPLLLTDQSALDNVACRGDAVLVFLVYGHVYLPPTQCSDSLSGL